MNELGEEICVENFLSWYNHRYKTNYIYERAENYFSELKGRLRWEFVAYERDNPDKWIGIEVKEFARLMEVHKQFEFWRKLCLELTQDLSRGGIQGEFDILPPTFRLMHRERHIFRKIFIEILLEKKTIFKANEPTDIGPDIAERFINWPKNKSDIDEYDTWGEYRPVELLIYQSKESGCKTSSLTSPIVGGDPRKDHTESFNDIFKRKKDGVQANKQLKLAKEMGASNTILLLSCNSFAYEDLINNEAKSLDHQLIADIDFIYLVDTGKKDRIIIIYPK